MMLLFDQEDRRIVGAELLEEAAGCAAAFLAPQFNGFFAALVLGGSDRNGAGLVGEVEERHIHALAIPAGGNPDGFLLCRPQRMPAEALLADVQHVAVL